MQRTGLPGAGQTGVAAETDLVTSWSPTGENLMWRTEFIGRSTPVILAGRVFVIGRRGEGIMEKGVIAAFDAKTGAKIW